MSSSSPEGDPQPYQSSSAIEEGSRGNVGKSAPILSPDTELASSEDKQTAPLHSDSKISYLKRFQQVLVRYNLEERGIQRVLPEHRHDIEKLGFSQICLLWISINLSAINLTLGMLAPVVYSLPFTDACLLAVFGMLIGSLPVAYMVTFGPRSGNRTMVIARYIMGWYPSKIIVVFSLIVFIGYSLVDLVIVGQMLNAVSKGQDLSIIVGIVITAVITWAVTTFGYSVFHIYERYAWLPQFAMVMILAGVAGPKFDLYTDPGASLDPLTRTGNRISFFSLALANAITYCPAAADFFVYYPEDTPRWKCFSITYIGLAASFTPVLILGIGLGSGVASRASWAEAYNTSQGALIVEGFRPLGDFGLFCGVVIALGLISNTVAPTYASGIDWQVLNRYFAKVPRVFWNTLSVVIYTVCAIAGRAHLAEIFTNFLALMGYFASIFIAITLEEHLIFRKWRRHGWDWEAWNDREKLPLGIAALIAFVIGWVGAILCMAQVWYIGPIAAQIGQYGGDLGNYVGFTWAGLVYPPMRYFELRRFGR